MSDYQVMAWLIFVVIAMFTGFGAGYFIGYDQAVEDYKKRRRG